MDASDPSRALQLAALTATATPKNGESLMLRFSLRFAVVRRHEAPASVNELLNERHRGLA
ncbi:MAG: hypothetical protein INH41_03010 [Myxococcaceae bacterium]|jgi:hypothetical protein|nr:hypothetical protein [Myxococcaceae bacterium]MCA3011350.1 hypothetical protein [Myxococcaceae bacterium]